MKSTLLIDFQHKTSFCSY